ncbi:MAG: TetR/AcrR family transcriptional regulator [Mycobacteriaceae bacterium]|nr:TetR/AcrR family transcriptional regulator [Mycobacteriaceae bacterium]
MRAPTDRRPPPRSDQRRTALLTSLNQHLQESTFESINVADISRRAGVTRSAFYFYFENKATAVAALMEGMYDDALRATENLTNSPGSPRQRIRGAIQALVETWERHRYLFAAMLEARAVSAAVRQMWDSDRESFVGPIAVMIDAERAAGRAPGGPPAGVLASLLQELNDRLLERLTIGGSLTREEMIDGAVTIWLRTIYGVDEP